MTDRFERHARTVTLLTLLSRITGLLRDGALSRMFGAGPLMSAFFFAFMIPNLFRRLFGEGALSAAFLPIYTRLSENDRDRGRAFASLTIAWMTIGLGGATLCVELVLIAIALTSAEPATVWMMVIMMPYMPLVCLVAVLGAMLQVRGRFGPAAASPVILNLAMIAAAVVFIPAFRSGENENEFAHVVLISFSVLAAGIIQLAWALWSLRAQPWWSRERSAARPEGTAMLKLAGPMILSLGVLQLNTFFDGVIASYPVTFGTRDFFGAQFPLDERSMAVISFAQRLYQFPLGVFGIAIATAIFPLLARQANDEESFIAILQRGLRLVVFIGLPASVGLMLVQRPLTAVIYEGGEFTAGETTRVAAVLAGYAPAIWAYSMTHVLTRAFYARGDSRGPMRIALAMVGLNLVLNCTLIWFVGEQGLAWSTAMCAVLQSGLLFALLRRRLAGILDREVALSWALSAAATALMAGTLVALQAILPTSHEWNGRACELAALVGGGALAFTAIALILRMPELHWALGIKHSAVLESRT